jgi:transcriptional regulator with XRE-family HTH domain
MTSVTASQLASTLGLSKGRISQLVSGGQLDGCYQGTGRQRRFDLAAAAKALNKKLDAGQMMGNGAATRGRLRDLERIGEVPDAVPEPENLNESGLLPQKDLDRYELARTLKAEEEARKLRRQNAVEDGQYVLASQVEHLVAQKIAKEVSEFETVLRDAARKVADRLGVENREVRQILIEFWRAHRAVRADHAQQQAENVGMSQTERDQDI